MILGADGERLSKRHGAVSVMQYRDEGFLPEALVNYLARLGWSHGDDESFSARAAGRVVRPRPRQPLAGEVRPGQGAVDEPAVPQERGRRAALGPDRAGAEGHGRRSHAPARRSRRSCPCSRTGPTPCSTWPRSARMFYVYEQPSAQNLAELLNDKTRPALHMLAAKLADDALGPQIARRGGERGAEGQRPENARARDAGAAAGHRPHADAVARRGARAARPGNRAGAPRAAPAGRLNWRLR